MTTNTNTNTNTATPTAQDRWKLRKLILDKISVIEAKQRECDAAINHIVKTKYTEYLNLITKIGAEIETECKRLGLEEYARDDVDKLTQISIQYKASPEIKKKY